MYPRDAYGPDGQPQLISEDHNDVYEDFTPGDLEGALALLSVIGRGPRGIGLTAVVTKSTEDCYKFSILTEEGDEVLESDNIHGGRLIISNVTEDTFDIKYCRDSTCVDSYTITMPKGKDGRSMLTTTASKTYETSGVYLFSTDEIKSENEIKVNDPIIFTTKQEVNSTNKRNAVDYVTRFHIGAVSYVGTSTYTITSDQAFVVFDGSDSASKTYVDESILELKEYVNTQDQSVKDYSDAQNAALKTTLENEIADEKTARIAGDAQALADAKTYATTKKTEAVAESKVYTNQVKSDLNTQIVEGDTNTLGLANDYTDEEIAKCKTASKVKLTKQATPTSGSVATYNLTQGTTNLGNIEIPKSDNGSFVYTQSSASSVWTIAHNLGFMPNVTIVDSAGSKCEGEIDYVDTNTVKLTFSGAMTGKAYLS